MAGDRARRDVNYITATLAESNAADGALVSLYADPTTHRLLVDASVTIAANSSVNVNQFGGVGVSLGQKAMTASMPVVIASDQTSFPVTIAAGSAVIGHVITDFGSVAAVTNAGTFVVQENGAALTSLQLIDDVIATLGTTTYTEATTKGAIIGAIRRDADTTLVDTTNEVAPLQVNAAGQLKIALITALPAGTNNIGDVDVLTVPADPFGANADAASATGSISAKLRFIASTGIPITGTVTVGSHAVTNAGTFVVQENGAALTSLQLIDDVIATLGTTTYTEATTKGAIIGAVRRDADTTLVDTTNEVAPLQVNAAGQLKVALITAIPAGSAVIGKVSIDQTTPGTTNLVALAANQSVNVAQMNGVTVLMGNGASGTGAQRVTIANDSTGVIGLSTGTNSIGKISDITTSVVPGTGATNLGKAEDAAHTSGDTGVFALGVRNDNLATTYGADQDYGPLATDLNGRVMVAQKAATATLANVSTSTTSATLIAANSARIGATITNEAATVLYVKFGTTASATSYVVSLAGAASAPYSYYEVPAGYTGRIDGILASSTGTARVSEIT